MTTEEYVVLSVAFDVAILQFLVFYLLNPLLDSFPSSLIGFVIGLFVLLASSAVLLGAVNSLCAERWEPWAGGVWVLSIIAWVYVSPFLPGYSGPGYCLGGGCPTSPDYGVAGIVLVLVGLGVGAGVYWGTGILVRGALHVTDKRGEVPSVEYGTDGQAQSGSDPTDGLHRGDIIWVNFPFGPHSAVVQWEGSTHLEGRRILSVKVISSQWGNYRPEDGDYILKANARNGLREDSFVKSQIHYVAAGESVDRAGQE